MTLPLKSVRLLLLVLLVGGAILSGALAAPPKAPPLVVWNGESKDAGAGWTSPKSAQITIGAQDKVAHSGRRAVAFHVQAAKTWTEAGWRWLPWFPPQPGTDVSGEKALTFWVKVAGDKRPGDLAVALASSPPRQATANVSLKSYVNNFADGQWHPVTIPLADLRRKPSAFNPRAATELFLGTWNAQSSFTVYVDDIGFSKGH